jgi:SAM-dependent methyltransferase
MTTQLADQQYYRAHQLASDRVALWWYARLLRKLRPQGGRLLDLGCGTGHLLKRLSPHFETFGYDPAPHARNESRTNAPDAVILEEWTSLPAASFDVIVALHTLEHLQRPLPTVEALHAKLVGGGLFFFVVPHVGGLGHRLKGRDWFAYRDPTHVSLLSRGEWMMVMRRAGLQVLNTHGDGLWDPPYIRALPTAVQRVLFGAPAALQVFWPAARAFLPPALGECLIVTARKP